MLGVNGMGLVGCLGMGPGSLSGPSCKAFRRASTLNNEMRLWARDSRFATADNEDCNSLQYPARDWSLVSGRVVELTVLSEISKAWPGADLL